MARTAADIAFFMESMDVRRMAVLDNRVAPVPFGAPRDLDLRGLRVGMLLDDGWLKPSPALARAVHEAADALRRRGCDVVPFVWSGTDEVFELFLAGLTADGGKTLVEGTAGGRLDPVLASLRRIVSLPTQVRATVARLAQALGDATAARVALAVGEKNVATLWKVTQRLRTARMALDDAMAQQGVEALLTPPMATPALPHGLSKEFPVVGAWSMLFNATGFPAGVVPVTRVRSGETERGQEPGRFARRARQVDAASQGLPVGVQVAARPWREDLVVALMMAIEEDVRTQAGFPTTPVDLQSP
jgi:fatty acid amide hydrolase